MIISSIILLNIIIFYNLDRLSNFFKIFDHPDNNIKKHTKKTFIGGGIIFYVNFLIIFFFHSFVEDILMLSKVLFVTSTSLFLIGLIDDKIKLPINFRLISTFTLLYFFFTFKNEFIIESIYLDFLDYKVNFRDFSLVFTIICFITLINIMNMSDGINCLSATYILTFLIYLLYKNQDLQSLYILLPGIITFFILNFKGRVFLGDGGIYFIYFLIGCMTTYSYNSNLVDFQNILIMFMIPFIDMLRVCFKRVINSRSPAVGDTNHLHHILFIKFNNSFFTSLAIVSLTLFPMIFYEIINFYYLTLFFQLFSYFIIIFFFKNKQI